MLGKYDFSKENINKIMVFFTPIYASIYASLDLFEDYLERNKLLIEGFLNLKTRIINMEYFDEFQEYKDEFLDFTEKTIVLFNKWDRENYDYNRLDLQRLLYSIKEVFLLIDYLIKKSYNNVNFGKDVLSLKEIKVILKDNILDYATLIANIVSEKRILLTNEQRNILRDMFNMKHMEEWGMGTQFILNIYEDKYENSKQIENYFEDDANKFWVVLELFVKIEAMCDINDNLNINKVLVTDNLE